MSESSDELKSQSEHLAHPEASLPTPNNNRQGAAKIALIALFGLGATWFAAQQALTSRFSSENGSNDLDTLDIKGLKPQLFSGHVVKTLEQFSLTSRAGITYHLNDPNNLINKVAKRRGVTQNLYELDDIKLKGIVSPVGNYGHMGR